MSTIRLPPGDAGDHLARALIFRLRGDEVQARFQEIQALGCPGYTSFLYGEYWAELAQRLAREGKTEESTLAFKSAERILEARPGGATVLGDSLRVIRQWSAYTLAELTPVR